MISVLYNSPALAAVISLIPALVTWWKGRHFAARLDDPALPERLQASRRVSGVVFMCSLIALTSMEFGTLIWSIPLTFIGNMAAAYPLRRVLYQETWGLFTYLSFFLRLAFVWLGFWVGLAFLPMIAEAVGSWDWTIGLLLGVVLLALHVRFADVVRFCLRTRPLEDGPLRARCQELADRCGLSSTRFERVDVNGGVLANALALPSLRGSSVLFSSTLLERLTEDEVVAICGHELGHLEHFDSRRLRKMALTTYALVGLAVVSVPATRLTGMTAMIPVTVLWFGLLLTTLVIRAKDKQRQETAADARAVALTGQPDALIAALSKLYFIARLPRRIEIQREQADSHPSLARRIRDIRRASGDLPAPLAAAMFKSPDGRTAVTFADTALEWADGDASVHRLNYSHLTEIRIDARGSQAPRLVVRGADATRKWEMLLAPADVAAAQTVLDVVDARLAASVPARSTQFPFHRFVTTFVMVIVWPAGQIAVAAVALLAFMRPAPQLLLASGLATLTAAGLMLRFAGSDAIFGAELAPIIGILGMVLVWIAYRNRHDHTIDARRGIGILAFAALVTFVNVFENGFDIIRLHQSAISATAAPVLLMALAGALLAFRKNAARVAAAAATLAATVTVVAASPSFLDAFARDPFLVAAPPVEWVQPRGALLDEFKVPSWTARVEFSPDGRYLAALQPTGSDEEEASIFHVGRAGTSLTAVNANDLLFAGTEDLLIVTSDDGGTLLSRVPLNALDKPSWRQYLPNVHEASLTFDTALKRWAITGWNQQRGIVRATGTLDSPAVDQRQWPAHYTQRTHVSGIATSGNRALIVEGRYSRGPVGNMVPYTWTWLLMLQSFQQEARYWTLDDQVRNEGGLSRLGADCHPGLANGDALLCTTYDGSRTRIFTIDPRTTAIVPIACFEGQFVSNNNSTRGWLTGWANSKPVAIQLATRRAFLAPPAERNATSLAPSATELAVVTYTRDGNKVRRYRLD